MRPVVLLFLAFVLLSLAAAAHGEGQGLEADIRSNTARLVLLGSAAIVCLVAASAFLRSKKKLSGAIAHGLFFAIAFVVVAVTVYVAGSTTYLNLSSETNGPVHWHADYEVWNCGNLMELVDPEGLSNRVGSAVLHEHNDNRVHVEGVVVDYPDVALDRFFTSVGGELHRGLLRIPTASGEVTLKDGSLCNGNPGILQVFVWKAVNDKAVQEKLEDYDGYVLSPFGAVPPGDCIIFEFGGAMEKTSRMCSSYEIAIEKGALNGG